MEGSRFIENLPALQSLHEPGYDTQAACYLSKHPLGAGSS